MFSTMNPIQARRLALKGAKILHIGLDFLVLPTYQMQLRKQMKEWLTDKVQKNQNMKIVTLEINASNTKCYCAH